MSDETRSVHEDELGAVIASYLEAADEGRPPDAADLLARYPHLADDLRAFLTAERHLAEAAGSDGPVAAGPQAETLSVGGDPSASSGEPLEAGTRVGPYKLLEAIGEGGMGTVYLAEQEHPVRRRVALKLIKLGMDSRQVVARFEGERQALALMDHPNIAKVLEAGATVAGRPYFVMELVKGVPITAYCDANRLSLQERLGLFASVCEAVQHAHQKGVIHRDLKPSNVLVALYDGRPVPKVIDFGLAKAVGMQLTEMTLFTGVGSVVGTPAYMSPEQARFDNVDIDTRSDVYSLGVLLYELLTGTTPVDYKRLKEAALLEVLRLVREEEPPRPSTRLSTTRELPSIAAARGLEPRRLSGAVRGELDWIVMKCLEKDRSRRYESASGLAQDVERYLRDEPVAAGPPSAWYRLRKLARRNRGAFVAGSAAVLVVLLSVAGLAVSNVLITRERNEKATALDEKAAALDLSRRNEEAYKEQFRRAEGNLLRAIQAIDVIEWSAWGEFSDLYLERPVGDLLTPGELATVNQVLLFHQAFVRRNSGPGAARLATAMSQVRAVSIQFALGRYADAESAAREGISLLERLAAEQPGVPEYRYELADCYLFLGAICARTGRAAEAEAAYREGIRLAAELLDRQERLTILSEEWQGENPHLEGGTYVGGFRIQLVCGYAMLGRFLHRTGRLAEAEAAYRQSLAYQDQQPGSLDAADWLTLRACATAWLGDVSRSRGHAREAEQEYRRAQTLLEKEVALTPGNRHRLWNLAARRQALGDFLQESGRPGEADGEYRAALNAWEELRAAHPTVPAYPRRLAWFLATCPQVKLRDPARAVALARKAVELAPTDGHSWVALAAAHYRIGNWAEALTALEKSVKLRNGGDAFDWFLLAMTKWRAGAKEDARQWYDKAIEWTAKNDAHNDDLRHLRVEAAGLIGTGVDWSGSSHVSTTALTKLEGIKNLRSLNLARTAVGDAELEVVARLSALESLDLSDTAVTAVGLKHLARLGSLKTLTLDNVDVTPATLAELITSRPGLTIQGIPAWGLNLTEAKKMDGPTAGIFGVSFAPNGKSVLSICDDWVVRVHDVQTGKQTLGMRAVGGLRGLAVTSDGRQAVTGGDFKTVQLWDLVKGELLREYEGLKKPAAAALSPDDRLVCACDATQCILWDRETGKVVDRFNSPSGALRTLAFSPDGRLLAVAGEGKFIWLWDVKVGGIRRELTGHTDNVTRVAFTPDGRHLLSASKDRTLRLWEVPGGREVRRYEGHGAEICSVAVSPDGKYALSGGMDRTLRLWELGTGRRLAVAKTDTPLTNYVAFSPDGRWAVSGGGWDVQPPKGFVMYGDFALRLWQIPAFPHPDSSEWK